MIDPISTLSQAQDLLRKTDHCLRHEVSKRMILDCESLIQSTLMLELEVKQRDSEAAVIPSSHRHD